MILYDFILYLIIYNWINYFKNYYINSGIKRDLIVKKDEVENSFKEVAKDKAVSWDLIPDICLKKLFIIWKISKYI